LAFSGKSNDSFLIHPLWFSYEDLAEWRTEPQFDEVVPKAPQFVINL
jgi:hypothetical protein